MNLRQKCCSLSLFLCLIVVYYIPQKVTFGPNIMFALYLIFVFRQKLYFQARWMLAHSVSVAHADGSDLQDHAVRLVLPSPNGVGWIFWIFWFRFRSGRCESSVLRETRSCLPASGCFFVSFRYWCKMIGIWKDWNLPCAAFGMTRRLLKLGQSPSGCLFIDLIKVFRTSKTKSRGVDIGSTMVQDWLEVFFHES